MTSKRLAAVLARQVRAALPGLAVTIAAASFAPTALAYDLLQAWRDAQINDAPLASARANLAATGERVTQARAGLLPQLGGGGSINRTHAEIQPVNGPEFNRNFTGKNLSISLTQPLFRLQNLESFEQSRLAVAQAQAAVAATELDLMLRVSQAYFDVLAAQDALTTIRAQKRAIAEQLESARRSFEVGTATITDQQEAQARFDLTTAQEIAAENALTVARSALQILVGRPAGELKTLARGVDLITPQLNRDIDWIDAARADNYTVQQLRVASEIARREIRRARFGHLPTVDLVGQVARVESATTALIGTRTQSASIGVQLNLPLYAGGALDARTRETVALATRAEADLENSRRQAEQAARQAFQGVASGMAQVRALEAGERSSQLALDSNLLGYQVGVRINIDVLNAQQQLFTTRRDLARARYDTLLNGLRLKQAAGALSGDDLAAVNALLVDAPPEPALTFETAPPTRLQGGAGRSGAAAGSSTGNLRAPGAAGSGPSQGAGPSGAGMPGANRPGTGLPGAAGDAANASVPPPGTGAPGSPSGSRLSSPRAPDGSSLPARPFKRP